MRNLRALPLACQRDVRSLKLSARRALVRTLSHRSRRPRRPRRSRRRAIRATPCARDAPRPRHRQLRLVHVQPRAVPGRARGHGARSTRTTRSTSPGVRAQVPDGVLISPGPCTPNEAGICSSCSRRSAELFRSSACASATRPSARPTAGGSSRAGRLMHGKTSPILHDGRGRLRRRSPRPFEATRYHSLLVERDSAPALSRGQRVDGRGGNHGPAPPRASASRACSFTRRASSRPRASGSSATGWRGSRRRRRERARALHAVVGARAPARGARRRPGATRSWCGPLSTRSSRGRGRRCRSPPSPWRCGCAARAPR